MNGRNIILITSGGIGSRFKNNTPKQYHDLHGKPVIAYVIDACKKSIYADSIVVAADAQYHDMLISNYSVDVCQSGETLNITKRRGLDYINSNYQCEKLVVVEAARPMIQYEAIDRAFEYLDHYDAVACARKITDSLGRTGEWIVNREEYYTMNPPEGFRFSLIYNNFDENSEYTESIQQLPTNSSVFLNFDVPYFDKITYPDDLRRIELLMSGGAV